MAFTKEIAGKIKIYTDFEKFTQTWFAGLRVFPGLIY
jgi:hypothetical protein